MCLQHIDSCRQPAACAPPLQTRNNLCAKKFQTSILRPIPVHFYPAPAIVTTSTPFFPPTLSRPLPNIPPLYFSVGRGRQYLPSHWAKRFHLLSRGDLSAHQAISQSVKAVQPPTLRQYGSTPTACQGSLHRCRFRMC